MDFSNGEHYHGYFMNGDKHGNGIYHYRNGEIYEGSWRNDVKSGDGILRL